MTVCLTRPLQRYRRPGIARVLGGADLLVLLFVFPDGIQNEGECTVSAPICFFVSLLTTRFKRLSGTPNAGVNTSSATTTKPDRT